MKEPILFFVESLGKYLKEQILPMYLRGEGNVSATAVLNSEAL